MSSLVSHLRECFISSIYVLFCLLLTNVAGKFQKNDFLSCNYIIACDLFDFLDSSHVNCLN